ncbi:Os01g0964266 [Oryza sativa Japonica Group]|uniref:Os01g0964266 protein n=1 Tax=Oryza sativa subsp. japonica TaxID=39947 RepID=A0A0P0VDC2_ORYSJ|nr:hypothetical protein EE612_008158 [Oryza sativa]BAS76362.1 Os01g0964266 [Oryza sativa Japonica Group]
MRNSEALPVNNCWARFIILILRYPHLTYLLEGAERSQDRPSYPDTVLAFRWSDNLDLHAAWSKGSDLLAHTVGDAREHCCASTQHYVAIQVLPDIYVALHDGIVGCFMDSSGLHTNHGWLEEDLRAPKPL